MVRPDPAANAMPADGLLAAGDDRAARRRYLRLVVSGALAAILIVAVAMGASVWQLRLNAIENATTEIARLNHVLAEQAEHSLEAIDLVLANVVEDIAENGQPTPSQFRAIAARPDFYRGIRAKLAALPQIHDVALFSAEGDLLGISQNFPPRGSINVADRDYFKALRDNPAQQLYISVPVKSRATGRTRSISHAASAKPIAGSPASSPRPLN